MQLLLIVNPFASSVSPRTQVLVQRALGEAHDVQVAETTRRNHATRLAEDAARRGVDGVVVLGGDGTVNEVANGVINTSCALLPLPGGSTNVFCRTLGLPDDPQEAVKYSLAAIEQALIRPVGVGSVNGRYFLFHTGVGFDAAVVEQVERQGDLKRYLNHPLMRIVLDALRPPAGVTANKFLDLRSDLTSATLRARRPVPVQVDGDFIGTFDEIDFRHHPNALRLARTDLLDAANLDS